MATIELEPHQTDFLIAPEQYVGLFGGIGNGKTFAGCAKILELMSTYPNNLCLIGRLTFPELRDSTKEVFMSVLAKTYPPRAYTENKAEMSVTLWNKSTVIFRHLDNQAALLGPNLGAFYVDQAEEVDEEAFETLQGRLRREGVKELKGLITGNPRGHDWVFYKFGMNEGWKNDYHELNWKWKDNYRMITAPTSANRKHLPDNYIAQLEESYSKDWFNRYVLGSWDGFEGQIFAIDKIRGYDSLPKFTCVVTGCDPAISKEKDACNTAFCTLGVGEDGFIYDIETIADKWDFMEQLEQANNIVKKHNTRYFGVEDVAYQKALAEALRYQKIENLDVIDLKADKDKFRRAKSVSHIIKQGLFRTNNRALLEEMIAFDPEAKGKAKKDRVDSLVHALSLVQRYAPIVDTTVEDRFDKGCTNSHELFFKLTREQVKREQREDTINDVFGKSNVVPDEDYY